MGTKVFLGKPPASIEQWIKGHQQLDLTIYKVQTTSSYNKTGIYSAQRDDTSKPVKIDWGDGVVEEVDGDVSQKFHEYSDIGEFIVKVMNIKSFAASNYDSTWYNTTSQNAYTLKELVNLNKAVTSIRNQAFYNCSSLENMTIPDSVTSIGTEAFSGCRGLTSVTIGNGVTSIGSQVFRGCTGLTVVYITDIAKWCGISFSGIFSNPLYFANNLYLNGVKVTDLVIPDSVTSIGNYAFYNCSGLTSVVIGNGVTSIGYCAFYGCSGLTSVTISDSVTSIGSRAFEDCSGLTSVTIPDSMTSIGDWAFFNCSGLANVDFNGTTVPSGDFGCFSNTSSLNDVYMMNIDVSMVQDQLNRNISNWELGVNGDGTYHTVTIHCMNGKVVIDPTPSGSSS